MTQAIVGKWGKSLAIRVPLDVARAIGLSDGEAVEIQTTNGDIHIHRTEAKRAAQRNAELAVEEIIAESANYSLGDVTIRELIDEGRR